jgi:response regulator RpfG family c-di-GMP phosphodiesterase
MSGFEVLRSLRVSKVKTPILILSGVAAIEHKVKGLGCGADDYMTKPFHKTELIARIHAIVRRSQGHAQAVVQTGDLTVNVDAKTVHIKQVRVNLTGKEYQMLELEANIVRFWHTRDKVGEPIGQVLKLLLLTGCRRTELAGMRRDELGDDAPLSSRRRGPKSRGPMSCRCRRWRVPSSPA